VVDELGDERAGDERQKRADQVSFMVHNGRRGVGLNCFRVLTLETCFNQFVLKLSI
jgi:RNA-splicing ligase RtcB